MSESVLLIISNIIIPIATYFFSKHQEKKKAKSEYANKIINELNNYVTKLDNNASKNALRKAYANALRDIEDFCKKYNLNYDDLLPLLTELYILPEQNQNKENNAEKALQIVHRLNNFFIKFR